jgi:hypothetical protein
MSDENPCWRHNSVNDTSLEFARLIAARYSGMRPEERVRIAAEMFDTARELVLASFPSGLSAIEMRRRLCRRFYGELADKAFP